MYVSDKASLSISFTLNSIKKKTLYQEGCIFMAISPMSTSWGQHTIEWGKRTYVMGIVNVTPDSFSGDGLLREAPSDEERIERAVSLAQQYVQEGAKFFDVGG